MRGSAILGLIVAIPLAFAVVLPQIDALQTATYGKVPSHIEPVTGTLIFMGLVLVVAIIFGLFVAIMSSISR